MKIRKSTLELSDGEWTRYKAAVSALVKSGEYKRVADIHAENHRMHSLGRADSGTARFLAWHRAYLLKFETLLGIAASDTSVTIPYWDWTVEPAIPAAMSKFEAGTPLKRKLGGGWGRLYSEREVKDIKALPTFDQFTYELETGPHNHTHGWVGGIMFDLRYSPRDPMFWMHHAQVDRVWAKSSYENSAYPPSSDGDRRPIHGVDAVMDPFGDTYDSLKSTAGLGYEYSAGPSFVRYGVPLSFKLLNAGSSWQYLSWESGYPVLRSEAWPYYLSPAKGSAHGANDAVRAGEYFSITRYDPYPNAPYSIHGAEYDEFFGYVAGVPLTPETLFRASPPGTPNGFGVQIGKPFTIRANGGYFAQSPESKNYFIMARNATVGEQQFVVTPF